MKTNTILMTALVAALAAAPSFAAGPMLDKAVQVAANNGNDQALADATALAAKEAPAAAADVFKSIVGQRTAWSKAGVYNVYNSVLFGSGLKGSFLKDLESYQKGINQQDAGVKLLTALNEACAKLPQDTFEAVVNWLVSDANGIADLAQNAAFDRKDVNTNGPVGICNTPARDARPHPAPVTPSPISPQN